MLGAKYDFSRDRERRAGVDDMVNNNKTSKIFFFSTILFSIKVFMSKNTDSEISHNLKIRFDVNYIYVTIYFFL